MTNDMKLKYYKKDDILVIRFSDKPVDDSFENESAILEIDKDSEPVALEILHAREFLKELNNSLPQKSRQVNV